MTLYNILSHVPGNQTATVADYISGEIYIDRKQTFEIIEKNDKQWYTDGLRNYQVYKIEIGKVYGDLIISVLKD